MLRCGLLGRKLGHSYSPQIHHELASYEYKLYEKEPEELNRFLKSGTFDGLNVTIPYKKAVMPLLDEISPEAAAIGSVNTIVNRAGRLTGYNTDAFGFTWLLQKSGVDVAGKKALVFGSGGASVTVCHVLKSLGADPVVVISRSGENNYENLDRHADAQLIVNATPVGMYPNTGVSPVELDQFPDCEGVFDLIYNPARTQLLLDAERRGLLCSNGLGMLVAQAKAAAERFLGRTIPDSRVEEITRQVEGQTQNLLLIGMPGCGKTTVGQFLADRLGRPLADVDHQVEAEAGCSIPDLFKKEGEEGFRIREHRALCQLSKQSGQVIACGGGIVTRRENRDPIRQNSTVIYLRRDLELLPTSGRPVSQAIPLEELYRRRAPLYEELADLTVENRGTPEETAEEIIRRLAL